MSDLCPPPLNLHLVVIVTDLFNTIVAIYVAQQVIDTVCSDGETIVKFYCLQALFMFWGFKIVPAITTPKVKHQLVLKLSSDITSRRRKEIFVDDSGHVCVITSFMVVTQKVVLVVFGKGVGEDIFRRRLLKELVQSCIVFFRFTCVT